MVICGHNEQLRSQLTSRGEPPARLRVVGWTDDMPGWMTAADVVVANAGGATAGSIRAPASCCGLYGLRPTRGAVPVDGVLSLAPSFDTVGWLAADPGVLRAVGSVLLPAGPAPLPRQLLCGQGCLAAGHAATDGHCQRVRLAQLRAARPGGPRRPVPRWSRRPAPTTRCSRPR